MMSLAPLSLLALLALVPSPPSATPDAATGPAGLTPAHGPGFGRGPRAPAVAPSFATNPATGKKVAYYVLTPSGSGPWPALVAVPGLNSQASTLVAPSFANPILAAGIALVAFEPPGFGASEGDNDNGGTVAQAAFLATLDAVAADKRFSAVGAVSRSYGVATATGALSRSSHPARFLVDWEGPPDRQRTIGCKDASSQPPPQLRDLGFGACNDEAYWYDREAIRWVGKLRVPYQRVQGAKDHVHSDNQHAIDMVVAAMKGGVPWVRIDDEGVNEPIDSVDDVAFLQGRDIGTHVARYAKELFASTAK